MKAEADLAGNDGQAGGEAALVPLISYRALEKSRRILEDIVLYYFPLHGLADADFFRVMPLLVFVEGGAYQVDEDYEAHIGQPGFVSPLIAIIRDVLTGLGVYDTTLDAILQKGVAYWRLEQQMCSGLRFTEEDIVRADGFRCSDYELLHRLLFKSMAKPYDEELLALCRIIEQRGEVEDDLAQYADDVRGNVYNAYRMFVRLHGAAAPRHLQRYLDALIRDTERCCARLAQTRPQLASTWQALQDAYYAANPAPAIPRPLPDADERARVPEARKAGDTLVPTISFRALEKSARTLEEFVAFYFALHDASPADFPRFMAVLTFVEGAIHQIDEEHEANVADPGFVSGHVAVLRHVLEGLDLWDDTLEHHLEQGLAFYRLGQRLCSGESATEADAAQAADAKSFDIRILHHLLCRLMASPLDGDVFEVCRSIEVILGVQDDLGPAAPARLRQYLDRLEGECRVRLAGLAVRQPDMASRIERLFEARRAAFPRRA